MATVEATTVRDTHRPEWVENIGGQLLALLTALELAGPPWLQWLLFGALSVIALLLFRRPLLNRLNPPRAAAVDSIVGQTAVSMDPIGIRQMGRVELRGTVWTACNSGAAAIAAGQRCSVERVEGLTLYIRA